MSLILSTSFMKQLKRLPQKEQGVVSRTVLDLQIDPTAATLSLHKVDGDAGWWSAYANGDLRIILARQGNGDLMLCWTDHHDAAYLWARRHKVERHPMTGLLQLIEIPEIVAPPVSAPMTVRRKSLCEKLGLGRDDLLAFGIPECWIDRVLAETDEDALLEIGENHLPPDAAEAVLRIAVGEKPELPGTDEDEPAEEVALEHDSHSWWVVSDDDALRKALDIGWEQWVVFLHPTQRKVAERHYSGPARVAGTAGTGKTVVALHHARWLLEQSPESRVLVTTFSENLAVDLNYRKSALLKPKQMERCDTFSLREFGTQCYSRIEPCHGYVATHEEVHELARETIAEQTSALPKGITPEFALSEWERVVDVRDLRTWEAYRDSIRRGVLKRLAEARRAALWAIFEKVREAIHAKGWITEGEMFGKLRDWYAAHCEGRFYTSIIVDESQDLGEAELAFLVAYAGLGPDGLFFAGDIGQRIIRYPFKWGDYGISLRGRSRILKVNYRTTQEIRTMADHLMDVQGSDPDGNIQDRRGTISLLSGPKPEFRNFHDAEAEIKGVAEWLKALKDDKDVPAKAIAVFFRSEHERERAVAAISASPYAGVGPKLCPMWDAKGLEYQAVVVMACDNDVIPSPERLAEANLVAGIDEIYETERNLLYVACTRARDYLLVTSAGTPSEFLLDMQ